MFDSIVRKLKLNEHGEIVNLNISTNSDLAVGILRNDGKQNVRHRFSLNSLLLFLYQLYSKKYDFLIYTLTPKKKTICRLFSLKPNLTKDDLSDESKLIFLQNIDIHSSMTTDLLISRMTEHRYKYSDISI